MNNSKAYSAPRHVPLPSPKTLNAALPLSSEAVRHVEQSRAAIQRILDGEDHRLLVVVGPCSIHDPKAALEYAQRLKTLAERVSDSLFLVMRVYFEKPRTTVGWKGLINDPFLDDSFAIEEGLNISRGLLVDLCEMGIPVATETLDPVSPRYLQDCISWAAIGARTTESQTHREMASGLPCPVGFKNGTDGSLTVAVHALQAVSHGHHFLGVDDDGHISNTQTFGNPYGHIVLRGGNGKPNYDRESIAYAEHALAKITSRANLMVDCSHANSGKDPSRQPNVIADIQQQILDGNTSVIGLMIESHLHWGAQPLTSDLDQLQYGVSITDGCIDWETTERCLTELDAALRPVLPARSA